MALDVEPARALVVYAAYAWNAGLSDAPRAAAMAKAHLCDVYVRATRAAVAAHGGIGYTWEYGLVGGERGRQPATRSEEHTSELQSLMRISYAVFCLKKKKYNEPINQVHSQSTTCRKQISRLY